MYRLGRLTLFLIISILLYSCVEDKVNPQLLVFDSVSLIEAKKSPLKKEKDSYWYYKDIFSDTIPGISLDKAYTEFLKDKKGKQIIVAVIDMSIDINHPDLKENIWSNEKEVPNNAVDDDLNGYVDDINGWNFLGHKNRESSEFVNYEYTRIIKKYQDKFGGKQEGEIEEEDLLIFKTYIKAKQKYSERMEYAKSSFENDLGTYEYSIAMDEALRPFFPDANYSVKKLDSLSSIFKGQEPMSTYLDDKVTFETYGITNDYILEAKIKSEERLNKLLNLDYDDRKLIGDNENDITDINYGNNVVNSNVKRMNHGTSTAGTIASIRNNSIGPKGISDNIKIMPLVISGFGDEHDKDMALAIRYAVDNGARVINISSGKYFSLMESWVHDAIIYANEKNVIVINSAGNENVKLNINDKYTYPNDFAAKNNEVSDNFLKVGSSGYNLKNLKDFNSNYSKIHVDLFAPGVDIYTLNSSDGGYKTVSGTSSAAAITSGVAALVLSYYPRLTASELKFILVNSGISFNVMTKLDEESTENDKVSFLELSKSGKILNAYYALRLAEKISN